MPNGMRWVGLDVHAHASAVAVFDDVTGEVIARRVNGRLWEVFEVLRELPGTLRAVNEANSSAPAGRSPPHSTAPITSGASRRRGGPGIRAHTNVRAFACEPGPPGRLDFRQRTLRQTKVLRPPWSRI